MDIRRISAEISKDVFAKFIDIRCNQSKMLKTNKSVLKRIKITGRKKMLRRPSGQDKYRAKKSGKTILKRRREVSLSLPNVKAFKKYLPNNL